MSENFSKMRERRAFFSAITGKCTSLEAFIRENGHWFDMVGIKLIEDSARLTRRIQLGYTDYEELDLIVMNTI